MNTKTMRLPPRRVLTPTKRKVRDDYKLPTTKALKPHTSTQADSDKGLEPDSSNQLLAGYFAYEYLTKGTLFGQPFDAVGAQPGLGSGPVESRKAKPEKKDEAEPSQEEENYKRYVEVASLLKTGGNHLPGIVNPTQLSGFLHM